MTIGEIFGIRMVYLVFEEIKRGKVVHNNIPSPILQFCSLRRVVCTQTLRTLGGREDVFGRPSAQKETGKVVSV